jgi:hypothetical protein
MDTNNTKKEAWWKPGLVLFLKVSSWIAFPIIIALYLGRYLDTYFNTGSNKWFFICIAISFFTTMISVGRIAILYVKKAAVELKNLEEEKAKSINTNI